MLSSLNSWFDQVYSNDTYLLAPLLDPRFKVKFLGTETTQSVIDQLIQRVCESASEIVPMVQGLQQDEPIQLDDDDQEHVSETSGSCNSQFDYSESDSIWSTSPTEPTSSIKRGISVYDSYKKAKNI